MFGLHLRIRPTAGLTFRRAPFSTLEMQTYPFIPPTTLSGFVERLVRLARGQELAEMDGKDLEFVVLPRDYHVLGALPPRQHASARLASSIHTTPRQGVRAFNHTAFSRLASDKRKANENFQLYRWEYLFAEYFDGFILHEDRDALAALGGIKGWGCKLGKEGWGFVEEISDPFPLELRHANALPSTITSADDIQGAASRLFPLYRYAWDDAVPEPHVLGEGAAPIKGFYPFLAAVAFGEIATDFYSGNGADIPASLLDYF